MSKIVDKEMIYDLLKNEAKPASLKYIVQRLKNFGVRKAQVNKILRQLMTDRKIEKRKNKFSVYTPHGIQEEQTGRTGTPQTVAIGRVDLKRDFGFVEMPDGKDIFIGRDYIKNLLPGDEVEVLIRDGREGKKEGVLKRIVKRTSSPVLCKARSFRGKFEAVPVNKPMPFIRLNETDFELREGNTILVSRIEDKNGILYGDVISHIGSSDPVSAYKNLFMSKYEFNPQFPREVEAEASRLAVHTADVQNRRDLRKNLIITVDPADAKDFDDAVSLKKKGDNYLLEVHIADVTRYVRENSVIDTEALKRSSSIYLPGEVIPMLPEALSNDLCSLKEGVDRLTFSIFMEIDHKGEIVDYEIDRAVINNKRRFTYEEVQDILDGKAAIKEKPIKNMLVLMDELRGILNTNLKSKGMIDFTLGEPKLVFDDRGDVTDIIRKEAKNANKIIEYFMIYANICAADFILKHINYGIFRVHPLPAAKDIDEFNMLMKGMGVSFRLQAGTNKEFQRVLGMLENYGQRFLIEKNLLRAMKLASYSEENTGHFGLGLDKYTHFTSPIRRYADVMVHRLIKHFLGMSSMVNFSKKYLKDTAVQISDAEERVEKIESDVYRIYTMDFMKSRLGESLPAIITKIVKNGIAMEFKDYPVEGFIEFDKIYDDYYIFDALTLSARGKRSKRTFRIGQEIHVIVVRVDIDEQKLFLEIEEER